MTLTNNDHVQTQLMSSENFLLLLNALLQILYQVVPGSGPLVVSISADAEHEIGSLAISHFGMKSLAKVPDWIASAEAR